MAARKTKQKKQAADTPEVVYDEAHVDRIRSAIHDYELEQFAFEDVDQMAQDSKQSVSVGASKSTSKPKQARTAKKPTRKAASKTEDISADTKQDKSAKAPAKKRSYKASSKKQSGYRKKTRKAPAKSSAKRGTKKQTAKKKIASVADADKQQAVAYHMNKQAAQQSVSFVSQEPSQFTSQKQEQQLTSQKRPSTKQSQPKTSREAFHAQKQAVKAHQASPGARDEASASQQQTSHEPKHTTGAPRTREYMCMTNLKRAEQLSMAGAKTDARMIKRDMLAAMVLEGAYSSPYLLGKIKGIASGLGKYRKARQQAVYAARATSRREHIDSLFAKYENMDEPMANQGFGDTSRAKREDATRHAEQSAHDAAEHGQFAPTAKHRDAASLRDKVAEKASAMQQAFMDGFAEGMKAAKAAGRQASDEQVKTQSVHETVEQDSKSSMTQHAGTQHMSDDYVRGMQDMAFTVLSALGDTSINESNRAALRNIANGVRPMDEQEMENTEVTMDNLDEVIKRRSTGQSLGL